MAEALEWVRERASASRPAGYRYARDVLALEAALREFRVGEPRERVIARLDLAALADAGGEHREEAADGGEAGYIPGIEWLATR